MKKIILTVFLCLASIGITPAKRAQITMHILSSSYKNKKHGFIHHAPSIRTNMSIVEIDDNNILISSVKAGTPVSLILNDAQGNVIYESKGCSSSSCLTIEIPSETIEEATSVLLTLNGTDYIGEIY